MVQYTGYGCGRKDMTSDTKIVLIVLFSVVGLTSTVVGLAKGSDLLLCLALVCLISLFII